MILERRRLDELKPAEYNLRKQLTPEDAEYQRLKRSIEEFGYIAPIVITPDGTIIGGHQRRTVLLDLGFTEAECAVVTFKDKAQERAANVALNNISGEWDQKKLKELLVSLDLEGYDFTVTGFTQDNLADLIQLTDIPPEAQEDGFNPDEAEKQVGEPETRRGDVWILGRHRLMCGDAVSEADTGTLLQGAQIDLVITDPPYNVDYGKKDRGLEYIRKGNTTRQSSDIKNDVMTEGEFYQFLKGAFQNANQALRQGGAIYVFHADYHGLVFRQAFHDAGFKLSQNLIWEKNMFVIGRSDYQWRHEPILYGWKPGAAHYFIKDFSQDSIFTQGEPDLRSMKRQELLAMLEQIFRAVKDITTVQYEAKPPHSSLHPTMKPVPLIGRLMNNSSKPNWRVFDPFGGSGTTLIAAEQLGRICYMMELDPRNCDIIKNRWEEYTGQKAQKAVGPN